MLDDTDDIHPLFSGAPKTTEFRKLRKRIVRNCREAVEQFGMVEPGARWLVCLSGGKDSYTMLDVLLYLQKVAPIKFEIVAVNMDQKQPGFPEHVLPEYLKSIGVEYHIIEKDTYSIVKEKNGYCCRLI